MDRLPPLPLAAVAAVPRETRAAHRQAQAEQVDQARGRLSAAAVPVEVTSPAHTPVVAAAVVAAQVLAEPVAAVAVAQVEAAQAARVHLEAPPPVVAAVAVEP